MLTFSVSGISVDIGSTSKLNELWVCPPTMCFYASKRFCRKATTPQNPVLVVRVCPAWVTQTKDKVQTSATCSSCTTLAKNGCSTSTTNSKAGRKSVKEDVSLNTATPLSGVSRIQSRPDSMPSARASLLCLSSTKTLIGSKPSSTEVESRNRTCTWNKAKCNWLT